MKGSNADYRIFGLDLLRALAISFVVIYHGTYYFPRYEEHLWSVVPDGVTLFFCLSGFLIARSFVGQVCPETSAHPFLRYWCKRIIRTIPPFIIAVSIYNFGVSLQLEGAAPVASIQSYLFLQNLAWPLEDGFPESWSLGVEEWFYALLIVLVFGLTCLRRVSDLSAYVAVTAALLILSSWLFRFLWVSGSFVQTDLDTAWMWTNYVHKSVLGRLDAPAIGVLAGVLSLKLTSLWQSTRFSTVCLLIGLAGLIFLHQSILLDFNTLRNISYENLDALLRTQWGAGPLFVFGPSLISVCWALLLPYCSALRQIPLRRTSIWVHQVAASAYSIYLWHYSITIFLLVPLISWLTSTPPELNWILYVVIGLGGAQLFYLAVERPFVQMKSTFDSSFATPFPMHPALTTRSPIFRTAVLLLFLITGQGAANVYSSSRSGKVLEGYAKLATITGGACNFELVKVEDGLVHVVGWAIVSHENAAKDIVLMINSELFPVRRTKRLDVASYFSNDLLAESGFSATLEHVRGTTISLLQIYNGSMYKCPVENVLP